MEIKDDISTEFIVIYHLLKSKGFLKKVLPFLDSNYFQEMEYQKITKVIKVFYDKYEKTTHILNRKGIRIPNSFELIA